MKSRFATCMVAVAALHLIVAVALLFIHLRRQRPAAAEGVGDPSATQPFAVVPGADGGADGEPSGPAAAPAGSEPRYHVVAKGEGYWVIARKYGVTMAALLAANGATEDRVLRPGDRLKIPARH